MWLVLQYEHNISYSNTMYIHCFVMLELVVPGTLLGPWSPSLGKVILVPSFQPCLTLIVKILSLVLVVRPSSFSTYHIINYNPFSINCACCMKYLTRITYIFPEARFAYFHKHINVALRYHLLWQIHQHFSKLLDWVFVMVLIAMRLDRVTPIWHYFSQ
jgi:hypothetical protein